MTDKLEAVRPESVGLCSERLARIDTHLERRYITPQKIAGALTLVARKGEVAHFSALGQMDLERNKPMREDTIFRIYSMTKPITSVALMMLYEHGFRICPGSPTDSWNARTSTAPIADSELGVKIPRIYGR